MKWNMLVGSLVLGASLCTPSFAGQGLLDRMLGLRGAGCDSTCCDTGCGVAPSCGCEVAPSCGCENACGPACGIGPSCGVENACAPSCGIEAACAPSCGIETACAPSCDTGCYKPRRKPLHELLCAAKHRGHHLLHHLRRDRNACDVGCCEVACEPSCGIADPSCGCEPACADVCAAPSCGCEVAVCDTGCGHGHRGLLARIFKHRHRNECCDLGCDSCGVAAGCNSCGGGIAPAAPAASGEAAPMPPAPVVDPSAYLQSNRRVIQATSYVR